MCGLMSKNSQVSVCLFLPATFHPTPFVLHRFQMAKGGLDNATVCTIDVASLRTAHCTRWSLCLMLFLPLLRNQAIK